MIKINVTRVGIFVIKNYRISAPNFFNLEIIFALSIFENVVASTVFIFALCCAVPRIFPVSEIQRTADGVEYVTVSLTVSLWGYGSYGSLWIRPSAVINIPPVSSTSKISNTIQNPEGGLFPITVSPYGWLVGVYNGLLNIWFVPVQSVIPKGLYDSYQCFSSPHITIDNETWAGCSDIIFLGGKFPIGLVSSFVILLM